jgi:hypothetical protein
MRVRRNALLFLPPDIEADKNAFCVESTIFKFQMHASFEYVDV